MKGYMEDMGNVPSRKAAACGRPALNATDNTEQAVEGDGYATRHDSDDHVVSSAPGCR